MPQKHRLHILNIKYKMAYLIARGGHIPAKPDPADPSNRLPARETINGWIWILFYFVIRFWAGRGFHVFGRVPPDHLIINIKKKYIYIYIYNPKLPMTHTSLTFSPDSLTHPLSQFLNHSVPLWVSPPLSTPLKA
jgi:hypothetical protein